MMSDHQILNAADHAAVRVHVDAGARFGDDVMASLAVPSEFRQLAIDYPILFRFDPEQRTYSALALFGFEQSENLFLDGDRWDAVSKPMAMTVRPFLIGRRQDDSAPAEIHIDMSHPRIATDGEGVRLFDDLGQPTPLVERMADMLGELDQEYRDGHDFFAALQRYDLIEPFSMDVTLEDGGQQRLIGYSLINEEKLRALEPAVIAELHEAGHLMPLFMALASLGNLGKLVRRRAERHRG